MCRYPLDIFSGENGNMKELLHRGTQADLNIYITTLNNGGIIGCGSARQHGQLELQTPAVAGQQRTPLRNRSLYVWDSCSGCACSVQCLLTDAVWLQGGEQPLGKWCRLPPVRRRDHRHRHAAGLLVRRLQRGHERSA